MNREETPNRRTKRRYAHELYPHGEEFGVRPLETEVPYLYARAIGADVRGTGWFAATMPESGDRMHIMIDAHQIALMADEKPRKDMAEMEIDGEYVRGGSVDHAATLKTMAQGLAAEMDAAQNAHRETVTHPPHYCSHPSGIETITITRHESFLRGNVLKYVLRAPYKGSEIEDLRKAAQYLQWEIDRAEAAL